MGYVRKPRSRMARESRKDAILDSAAELLITLGPASFSMEKLRRSLGVSKSTVYAYFPSQALLLTDLLGREVAILRARLETASHTGDSLESRLRAITPAYLDFVQDRGNLFYSLIASPASLDTGPLRKLRRELTEEYSGQLIQQCGLDSVAAVAAVVSAMGIIDGAARQICESGQDSRLVESVLIEMLESGVNALAREVSHQGRELKRVSFADLCANALSDPAFRGEANAHAMLPQ